MIAVECERRTENIKKIIETGDQCKKHHAGGIVVAYVPATDETRVRFPAGVLL